MLVHTRGFPHPFTKRNVLRNDCYALLTLQVGANFYSQSNLGGQVMENEV